MMERLLSLFAAPCPGGNFFGLPTWHKYLPGEDFTDSATGLSSCTPKITHLTDIWLVVAAVIEMLLRVAALAAVVFIVYGGIQYIMSQGEPDKTAKARSTVINALIGLVLSVGAATFVTFIAGRF